MSQQFIGEIRPVGFNFAPVDWALCDGSLISIGENEALYTLIGTAFGGDGVNTFALPDLRGRVPIHQGTDQTGTSWVIGQRSGAETVTLITSQIPTHNHLLNAQSGAGTASSPSNSLWASSSLEQFSTVVPTTAMAPVMQSAGGSQPHDNMTTFGVVNYIIALYGIFPTQS